MPYKRQRHKSIGYTPKIEVHSTSTLLQQVLRTVGKNCNLNPQHGPVKIIMKDGKLV